MTRWNGMMEWEIRCDGDNVVSWGGIFGSEEVKVWVDYLPRS
jgi:hypothetical protein